MNGFQNRRCSDWPDVPVGVVIIGIDIIMIGSQKNGAIAWSGDGSAVGVRKSG
ncbi:hypothetical protein [Thiocapsa rosea]|uniref:hypothetical protein n=1 Tax=Thiocapsa rosea TaxID=69360 RepID=UPI001FEBCBEF|nr:hypothetical protein [Thiocapsa rosea]